MKRTIFIVIFVFTAIAIGVAYFPRYSIPSNMKEVVKVGYGCSGFIIAPGIVATAGHCARVGEKVKISFIDSTSQDFTVIASTFKNKTPDYAILKGNTEGIEPLKMQVTPPVFRSNLYYVGYGGGSKDQSASFGYMLLPQEDSYGYYYEFAGDVIPGDSGSPLLNSNKEVVGIVVWTRYPAPVGYATPIIFVYQQLKSLGFIR